MDTLHIRNTWLLRRDCCCDFGRLSEDKGSLKGANVFEKNATSKWVGVYIIRVSKKVTFEGDEEEVKERLNVSVSLLMIVSDSGWLESVIKRMSSIYLVYRRILDEY